MWCSQLGQTIQPSDVLFNLTKFSNTLSEGIECDHYDPFETSNKMKELYRAKITQDELRKELLSRMSEK